MKTRIELHLIIYMAIIATLLAACKNEIPYTPGTQKPQLIMNALLDVGKTENEVILHLGEGNSIGRLHEATLTLFVNGQVTETPQALTPEEIYGNPSDYPEGTILIYESIRYKLFRLATPFHPGDHIRLEATAENGKYHASAEVTVPEPIESLHVDTCLAYLREDNKMIPCRQYKITLQDRPGEKNYYRLEIRNENSYRCLWKEHWQEENEALKDTLIVDKQMSEIINREDVILTDGHPGSYDDEENELFPTISNKYNLFNDNTFRNSQATLKVYTSLYQSDYLINQWKHDYKQIYRAQAITVRLLTLTEAEYRYLKALNCLEDGNYDDSLMEPVCLPSNVNGGLGFVGACSEASVILKIPEQRIR